MQLRKRSAEIQQTDFLMYFHFSSCLLRKIINMAVSRLYIPAKLLCHCWFVKHRLHFFPVAGSRQRVEIFSAIRMPKKYYPTLTRHQVICSCKASPSRP